MSYYRDPWWKPYYRIVGEGGVTGESSTMKVFLYPYEGDSRVDYYCERGEPICDAITTTFDHVLEETDISGYEIFHWQAADGTKYPKFYSGEYDNDGDDSTFTMTEIGDLFQNFLENGDPEISTVNGWSDLTDLQGCHHLAHYGLEEVADSCGNEGGWDEKNGGYAPSGANGTQSAYPRWGISWAPLCGSNIDLTKSGTVQEVLHPFNGGCSEMQGERVTDTYCYYENGNYICPNDEHTLGDVVTEDGVTRVTPMMEYHWDDNLTKGDCSHWEGEYPNGEPPIEHDFQITNCTVECMGQTWEEFHG